MLHKVQKQATLSEEKVIRYDANAFITEVYKYFDANPDQDGVWRFVYANIDGDAVVESGLKGGHVIRSIKTVFDNVDQVLYTDLYDIIFEIKRQAKEKVKRKVVVPQIEYVGRMSHPVYFEVKQLNTSDIVQS